MRAETEARGTSAEAARASAETAASLAAPPTEPAEPSARVVREEEPPPPDEAPPEAFSGFAAAPKRPSSPAPLSQVFDRLRSFAQDENRGLFAALEGGRLLTKSEDALQIALPSAIASRRLESRKPDLESVIARFFGKPMRVELVVDASDAVAPNQAKVGGGSELARKRRQEALAHPAVNTALEILGAEIDEIRPLGGAS
jgi:hypothetical protein